MVFNSLFNQHLMDKYIRKYKNEFKLTHSRKNALLKWKKLLDDGELKNEESNYGNFSHIILEELLGYVHYNDIKEHKKVDYGMGRSEFIIYKNKEKFMVIELKGANNDLDKPQAGRKDNLSPVEQGFKYVQNSKDSLKWVLISNYDEFRLYNYEKRLHQYISFKIEELLDPDVFEQFMLIFSKFSTIETNLLKKLVSKTVFVERDFEREFYKLYHETRLMLLAALEYLHPEATRAESVHYAQLIMNRYIFICFAEDLGLLPEEISVKTVENPIKNRDIGHSEIWHRLNNLFIDINEGNNFKKIFGYNGGLFKEDLESLKIRDIVEDHSIFNDTYQKWKFEEYSLIVEDKLEPYGNKINPVYRNLMIISSFNFSTEVDVNILGHIFENSIGEIEELKADTKGRRKKDGIFYTPGYITDYICRNTIIPYLSKSGKATTVDKLIEEYWGNIGELDKKVEKIKIVDPACGSGAFLNKASDILLEIHEAIFNKKYGDNSTLDRFFDSIEERRRILLNNIYGVDLNEESVEITKLSLFLKVCKRGLKLPNLDSNIKCGNSLIDDPQYTDKPFKWEEEFKDIFKNNGFDIVIGNPPYVRADNPNQQYQKEREWMRNSKQYVTLYEKWDLFIAFIERGLKTLKKNGIFSFIISNSFNTSKFADKSKKFIFKDYNLKKIDFFKDVEVFKGVGVESVILIVENNSYIGKTTRILHNGSFDNIIKLKSSNDIEKMFRISEEIDFVDKFENTELLGNILYISKGMVLNADEKKFKGEFKKDDLISENKTSVNIKPYIEARDIERYKINRIRYLEWNTSRVPSKVSRPTFLELYSSPKLIRGNTTEGIYDNNGMMFNHGIYGFVPFNSLNGVSNRSIENSIRKWTSKTRKELEEISLDFDIQYILSILNSKFAKFYLNTIRRHRIEYYFYPDDFKRLPIKKITLNEQESFAEKALNILKLNNEFINEKNGFKEWLKRTYKIEKFTQKLDKYYGLSFEDFLKELKKKKVDIKPRKTQEFLKKEFEDSLNKINPLLMEIEKTDNEIDQMVYELYELSEDEIKIIEDSF